MPRHDEISITAKRDVASRWQQLAVSLGYGERGRFKILRVILDFADENRSLFRIRS